MSRIRTCPKCGAEPTGDLLEGLCPKCVAEAALAFLSQAAANATFAPVTEKPGDGIGPYKLLEQIGEGGCGVVYLAEQVQPLRRQVALKVIKLGMDTRQVVARFEAERQTLALMDHPNIARVFDAGATETGRPYFVMELVRGVRITEYCHQHRLPTHERLALFMQVCHAIQHAHQKGIIHRDIKPSNILVTMHDGIPVPKVIDFGIAKATQQPLTNKTVFTAFQQFIGTPAYMSPEQAGLSPDSSGDIDTRSDIYSLGMLLYELLAGQTPFDTKRLCDAGLDEILRVIREEEPPRPSTRLATELSKNPQSAIGTPQLKEVRGDLDWIVMKCLEKDRRRRFETANGLAADIQRFLSNEPVLARPPSNLYRFQKTVRRNKLAFVAVGAVALALVIGLGLSTWMFHREKRAKERLEVHAYMSDMGSAARMATVTPGGLEGAIKLLEAWQHHQPDLRGWEWYYLNGLCHQDLLTIRADSREVWSVTWSPDGKRLATAGTEGTVKIWDAVNGRPLQVLNGHTGEVKSVVWSPDGRRLASGGQDQTVRIWELETGGVLTCHGHRKTVSCLAWSSDAKQLVSGSHDQTVKFWNPLTGTNTKTFNAEKRVVALGWSKDGTHLVASRNGSLKCWDVASGREFWSWPTNYEGWALTVDYAPDGRQLAAGGFDNAVSFLDATTGTNIISFWDNNSPVNSVAWNPGGTLLASATRGNGRIVVRDLRTGGKVIRDFRGQGSISCVRWRPDGDVIASASTDGTVKLWNVKSKSAAITTLVQPDQVPALAWSPDSTKLATGSRRTAAWIWDMDSGGTPMLLRGGYTPWTSAVVWNPQGTQLAFGGADGFEVWEPTAAVPVWQVKESVGGISAMAWSPDSKQIATVGSNAKLSFWNSATGKPLRSLDLPRSGSTSLSWSPDGRNLATGVGREIYVWDFPTLTQKRILSGHTDGVNCLAWRADSVQLASGSADTSAKIWDVRSGREISTLLGHAAPVSSVVWSPDATRLATGSSDLSLKIWEPVSGMQICSFEKPDGIAQMINAVAWSPDGRRIACSDIEGYICILNSAPGHLGGNAGEISARSNHTAPAEAETIRSLKLYCETVQPYATNNADALRRLAWILATSRYPEVRDGRKAVAFAEQAVALNGNQNAGLLSILAAAYAETGDFTNAIYYQTRAIGLSRIAASKDYPAELRLYESHQPYRNNAW